MARVIARSAMAMLCLASVLLSVPVRTNAAEAEPASMTCWWRTNRVAVLVGQRFTLTVTCRVVTNDKGSVVVDPAQFDAGAVSLTPYEVVTVNHPDDVLASGER